MRLLLLLALMLGLAAPPARAAGDAAGALAGLKADSFDVTRRAVEALSAGDDPRALPILRALGDGRLLVRADGAAFYPGPSGALVEAATGAPAPGVAASELRAVRLNNGLRRAVAAAIGALAILAPEPDARRSAANALFRSREAEALPGLDKALARESDAGLKALMGEARASILLAKPDAPEAERVAAARVLQTRGDRDALGLLNAVPPDAPVNLREAAAKGAAAIEERLALWGFAQNAFYGLSLGSVLLLAAVGLAITFGVMGVINMAHGEFVMVGAYATYVVQQLIRDHAPGLFDWSLAFALPAAFLVTGLLGVLVERTVIRFLYGRPLETLLATFGVSLILQQAIRTGFGPTNREVGAPRFMSGSFQLGELTITNGRAWIVAFAALVFAALLLVLARTSLGLRMRAVTQNRRMAAAMGIDTARVDALTFGLGSGIAGLAGVALSQIDNVSPNLGQSYIIDAFLVVVFGGVGNLWGTLVAALGLGIANKALEPYAGAVLAKIALLVLVILFIQRRPRGLFALKGRAVEA